MTGPARTAAFIDRPRVRCAWTARRWCGARFASPPGRTETAGGGLVLRRKKSPDPDPLNGLGSGLRRSELAGERALEPPVHERRALGAHVHAALAVRPAHFRGGGTLARVEQLAAVVDVGADGLAVLVEDHGHGMPFVLR